MTICFLLSEQIKEAGLKAGHRTNGKNKLQQNIRPRRFLRQRKRKAGSSLAKLASCEGRRYIEEEENTKMLRPHEAFLRAALISASFC